MAATLALLVAAPAASADTFKTTFGADQANVFDWEGNSYGLPSIPSVISNGCGTVEPVFRCDLVVYQVKTAGDFEASITMDEAPTCDPAVGAFCTVDLDLHLYKSDAEGAHPDDAEPIADSATAEQTETLKAKLTPGFYVLEVEPYEGQDVPYKGTSKFTLPYVAPVTTTEIVPETVPPPPVAEPAPAAPVAPAVKATGKRAACRKKAKKIRAAKKRRAALKRCAHKPV